MHNEVSSIGQDNSGQSTPPSQEEITEEGRKQDRVRYVALSMLHEFIGGIAGQGVGTEPEAAIARTSESIEIKNAALQYLKDQKYIQPKDENPKVWKLTESGKLALIAKQRQNDESMIEMQRKSYESQGQGHRFDEAAERKRLEKLDAEFIQMLQQK